MAGARSGGRRSWRDVHWRAARGVMDFAIIGFLHFRLHCHGIRLRQNARSPLDVVVTGRRTEPIDGSDVFVRHASGRARVAPSLTRINSTLCGRRSGCAQTPTMKAALSSSSTMGVPAPQEPIRPSGLSLGKVAYRPSGRFGARPLAGLGREAPTATLNPTRNHVFLDRDTFPLIPHTGERGSMYA
jgi:hypothetical protein